MLTSWLFYDFGYSWPLTRGHGIVFLVAISLTALAVWRGWPRWTAGLFGVIGAWGLAGALVLHSAVQISSPITLPTASFVPSGEGRVLDLGAGSGRATLGVLLSRPKTMVTAVDLYEGYYGIDDNTPDRLRRNARQAGVEARLRVQTADMRHLPFEAGVFDAALSVAAMDHLRPAGIEESLREAARVLRPGGQLLIVSLNSDRWVRLAFPHAIHGHGFWGSSQDGRLWREAMDKAGLEMTETGTRPATVYFLAHKRAALAAR
jgi:SAM-dependent methyltransferase